ncbi:extracellular solute-binding protein [Uliginosibacterium sp. H3]|uniref:Extracellular solute-binding protein n=1 Tax=Uliginosibacterium silvisoli TaxID=3114758 RepID=A0ABU6K3C6_9RHOO|nr:extracellular solute-binding protein [Uliginosibacterium sp. H3]
MMVRVFVLVVLLFCKPALAMETLRVLAWPGYASPETIRSFEAAHNAIVELSVVSTDDELWNKGRHNNGGDFDVIALNSVELRRFIDKGLVTPLQLRNIPNVRRQLPRFRNLASIPGLAREGHIYGVPFTYSAMGLIYNRKLVTETPTSMNAMWDPRYRGKVLAYNSSSHSFSFTALALGLPDPFNLNTSQFRQVLDKLISLRSNVLKFYSQPEEVVDIFRDNEIALIYGNYGEQQLKLLRAAGADIGYVMPSEGALAWLDCWAIMSQASNRGLAEAWINHMLTPGVSGQLTEEQGFANTLRETPNKTMRDSDKMFWLAPVEDVQKRASYWERLMSGAAPRPRY